MSTITVASRINPNELALARDGLISRGISSNDLCTKSAIIRVAIFLAITCNEDPDAPPTEQSMKICLPNKSLEED